MTLQVNSKGIRSSRLAERREFYKVFPCPSRPLRSFSFMNHPCFYATLFLFLICSILFSFQVFSQAEKKYIRNGNKDYEAGKYEDAEKNYQQALEKNASSVEGKFNMADALYRQEKYEEAAQQFGNITSITDDKILKSKAFHNLGNSLLQSKKIKESVDAYKNALRNNPKDEDTRKNLAYAMKLLQQQQQQQQQNEKNDQKEDQEKKDQQQEQNQEEKNQEKQDKKNQQQEKQDQQQQEQQQEQKKDQLSKQDAQRLLESMNNDEKKLQEKLKKEKLLKAEPVHIDKDW